MTGLGGWLARFNRNRAGSVATIAAITAPLMIGAGAFAVDMGNVNLQRRVLQGATDAAALAAISRPDAASQIVRSVLDANGLTDAAFTVTFGSHSTDPATDRDKRFTAGPAGDAVRIEASLAAKAYLAQIFGRQGFSVSTQSEASLAPVVSLSAGSRLASVEQGAANELLKKLTGASIDLKVADYNGLVRSNIDLGPLLEAAARKAVQPLQTDALVGDVLDRPIKLSALLLGVSEELDKAGDRTGGAILRKAAGQTVAVRADITLGAILGLDDGIERLAVNYPGPALSTKLSVLSLLNAAVRSEGIGNVINADLTVPGLAKTGVQAMIGEAAVSARSIAVAQRAPKISTDQVRIRTTVETSGLLNLLTLKLYVPVEVVVAGGTAEVVSVSCAADPARREVKVSVLPGVAKLAIGKWSKDISKASVKDELAPVDIVSVLFSLVRIEADAFLPVVQTSPILVTFKGSEIGNGTVKTAKTSTLTRSLVSGLLQKTKLSVHLPLLSVLSVDGVTKAVAPLLTGLTVPLDALLTSVLDTAGVGLGEMDVRVDDLVCTNARIVG